MTPSGSIAVMPGSFDPITYGHLDLLERSLKIFDEVVVAVAHNPTKQGLFTLEERLGFIEGAISQQVLRHRVRVGHFQGLLVEYAKSLGARAIVRGLRAVSDFEYEFQMALMNRRLDRDMETIFLMTGMRWIYISSRIIKEVVLSGGSVKGLVPDAVERALVQRLKPNGTLL